MDFDPKKFYIYCSWLNKFTVRNAILLFHYTKLRLLWVLFLVLGLILLFKRSNIDGLSSILYGLQYNDPYKNFPLSWFLFILGPILVVGDASSIILRQDFKANTSTPYLMHIIINSLTLWIALIFSYIINLFVNNMVIYNRLFLIYLTIFHIWLLLMFQLLSTFVIQPYIAIIFISALLIIDTYIPIIPIINQTMLSRFNSNDIYFNLGLLFIILFLTIIIVKAKIKNIDFIKGVLN